MNSQQYQALEEADEEMDDNDINYEQTASMLAATVAAGLKIANNTTAAYVQTPTAEMKVR